MIRNERARQKIMAAKEEMRRTREYERAVWEVLKMAHDEGNWRWFFAEYVGYLENMGVVSERRQMLVNMIVQMLDNDSS